MSTTIPGAIKGIKEALELHFANKGLEWKAQESQDEHSQQKPVIYPFLCADRNGANFPTVCPSITIEVTDVMAENQALTLGIVLHCVVVNSAIIEREHVQKKGDFYEFLDGDGYTDTGVVESLYSDCLLLGEEALNALRPLPSVKNIKLVTPDSMDDFPYCQCQVSATVSALAQFFEEELL